MEFLPKAPLRVAVIGIGHRGYNTHFLSCQESGRLVKVVAVCDVNQTALSRFSQKHADVPAYNSLADLLSNHKLDFAIVCVPHKYHLECCTTLAAAGVAVLKEKPVAETLEEYAQLCSLPTKIGVTFQKRFEPRYRAIESLLPQVGQVASFRATLAANIYDLDATWRAEQDVGTTEDLGCHMLDIVVSLFGRPSSLKAHNAFGIRKEQTYGGDDISNILMTFGEGSSRCIGHIHLSRVAHSGEESLIITGTNGSLVLKGKEVTMSDTAGKETFRFVDTSSKSFTVKSMLQSFSSWIRNDTTTAEFPTSLERMHDLVNVMDATRRSYQAPAGSEATSVADQPRIEATLDGEHHVWPLLSKDSEDAIIKQMHSSLSIYNRSNIYEVFEERWRKMHNLKHALVCSSGTIALYHMFEALDLRPGDEILCPVYTFFATATPMLQYGAVPVFCDSLDDGNMDPAEILKRTTPKTKAVIVTHMWGLPCRMREIVANARKVNGGIKVLEDCSHAHGSVVDGRLVGTWGDMAAWSLQAKKNLTGGQAGVLATNSTDYYSRAILHGHFNKRAKQEVPADHPLRKFWLTGLGLNMRAHPLAIALANQQLDLFPKHQQFRQAYADYIINELKAIPFLKMPELQNSATDRHAWYALVMQFDADKAPKGLTREKFVKELTDRGLKEVDIPKSTGLLNEMPLFTHSHEAIPRFGSKPWHAAQPTTEFPKAQNFFDKAIKLPVWATANDRPIVERYVREFLSVAEESMQCSLAKQGEGSSPIRAIELPVLQARL
ncbi:hypothetical protein HIM_02894 [Hirsutella minnesotensis 3608]|nr:hypothetical protein HIM_02894 [Hirsutella minnesotensis 3608]